MNGSHSRRCAPIIRFVHQSRRSSSSALIAGDCDLLLRVLAKDLDDYRRFQIEHLGRIGGVRDIKIDIPMQKGKQSAELPVRLSGPAGWVDRVSQGAGS